MPRFLRRRSRSGLPRQADQGWVNIEILGDSSAHTAQCNADYVLKENTTMYALWDETVTPITYYIEFDGNAGTAARNIPDKMEVQ